MAWHSPVAAARFRPFSVALALGAIAAACSSGNAPSSPAADASVSSDAGAPAEIDAAAGNADAGSPLVCSPASVQGYSPKWVPPKPHTSSCTVAQIDSYAACLATGDSSSAPCAPWFGEDAGATNADCRTCFNESNSTDPSWGPIVDTGSIRQVNVAGCIALVDGDTGGTGCASQYQALQGCESAACATNCKNASAATLASCVAEADNVGCSTYLAAAACVNDAGAADVCFGPPQATFAELFAAVGTVFCLATAGGGAVDAGGGPVDAGGGG